MSDLTMGAPDLAVELAFRASMERDYPGFYKRNPIRAIERIGGGWQYGYEIAGYGTVVGHCRNHEPHKTQDQAEACGARFEAGMPELSVGRQRLSRIAWWRP